MKRNTVHKALIGVFGTCLLLTATACSGDQKKADLGPAPGAATTGATTSSAVSSSATGASSSSAAGSSSSSSTAASSSAAGAPTTVATSSAGWSYKATVPTDPSIAAALTAFQNYTAVIHDMGSKAHDSNELVKYADGNVLSLTDDWVAQERRLNVVQQGTETIKVTAATLDANAKPPVVTITTCTDDTKYFVVFTSGPKKGQPAQVPDKAAYPNVYKVHLGTDGKWRVNAVTPESNKTC